MLKHRKCVLALVALGTFLVTVPAAAWQAPQSPGAADTLYVSLQEARELAIGGNPVAESSRLLVHAVTET